MNEEYINVIRSIEQTVDPASLTVILQEIDSKSFTIEQKELAKSFAQLRFSYEIVKRSGRNSVERDKLAEALDVFRFYEHDL